MSIAAGERVLVEVSRKFTPERLAGLAYKSGLYIQVLKAQKCCQLRSPWHGVYLQA